MAPQSEKSHPNVIEPGDLGGLTAFYGDGGLMLKDLKDERHKLGKSRADGEKDRRDHERKNGSAVHNNPRG